MLAQEGHGWNSRVNLKVLEPPVAAGASPENDQLITSAIASTPCLSSSRRMVLTVQLAAIMVLQTTSLEIACPNYIFVIARVRMLGQTLVLAILRGSRCANIGHKVPLRTDL